MPCERLFMNMFPAIGALPFLERPFSPDSFLGAMPSLVLVNALSRHLFIAILARPPGLEPRLRRAMSASGALDSVTMCVPRRIAAVYHFLLPPISAR